MIRVGLLGAGAIGRVHAAAFHQVAGARLAAVADIDRPAVDSLATEHGARACYSMDELLSTPGLDMLDVCVPTYLHADAVIAAAAAGKHVLCEKPVALTLEDVDRMSEAVGRAGVCCMIAQVIRFWPQYVTARDLLARGELGRPLSIQAERLGRTPTRPWYNDPRLSGGALFDLHIHDLDYVFWLLGKPRAVYAHGLQSASGAWNHLLTSLDYGHTKATVTASFMMPDNFPFTMHLRLLAEKGCVEYWFQGAQRDLQTTGKNELQVYLDGKPPWAQGAGKDPYLNEIEYFVGCVQSGSPPTLATLAEARSVLEMTLAVRRSLESGTIITF